MIVKNEENTIGRCLSSVKDLVDEIIIVDTGSTDRTKEIVQAFNAVIYDFEWVDDFAAARNYAFSKATQNYILWLDADDVILPQDRTKFSNLIEHLEPDVDSVTMNYHLSFDEDGNVTSSLRRNRLVKKSRGFQWHGAVHEFLAVGGKVIDSNVAVTHISEHKDSDRNLLIYEKRLAFGEQFEPRDMLYYANELKDHARYEEAAEYYEKFLVTELGWVEDNIAACGKLADCYERLGDEKKLMESLMGQFQYDLPRAEICCRVGLRYFDKQDWEKALFWYELATRVPQPNNKWGFRSEAYWTWLPHVQLCVCYDRLGNPKKAYWHNERAREFSPSQPSIVYNQNYFKELFADSSMDQPPECRLSILIPSVPQRLPELTGLLEELEIQTKNKPVEILVAMDNKKRSIGAKRNQLLEQAQGNYVAFIDDDDLIKPNYVAALLEAIEHNPRTDCIVFDVEVRLDGSMDRICKYDKNYTYGQDSRYYYHKPNHLMCYARRVAIKHQFADPSYGEDDEWAERSSVDIERQTRIDEVLYVYDWKQKASDWYEYK